MYIANLLKNRLPRGQRLLCLLVLFSFFLFFLGVCLPSISISGETSFWSGRGKASHFRSVLLPSSVAHIRHDTCNVWNILLSLCLSRRAFFRAFVGRKILAESSSEEAATWKHNDKKRCVMKALSLFGPDLISRVCASEHASELSRVHFSAEKRSWN